ncbi:hypothetical protein PoB_000631400 [Plakobranchus ocellatus]|uniref:Uncharacterized protein n=1 Tax=Plakobranchus ocellatus TaxID=259542 RepID=A0AAV3YCL3_9GAST|nr:hypothetical protein PoB_000631400 [Plakobranchus ocellatus]
MVKLRGRKMVANVSKRSFPFLHARDLSYAHADDSTDSLWGSAASILKPQKAWRPCTRTARPANYPVYSEVISDPQAVLQVRSPVAELEAETEESLQISGRIHYSLCHIACII